MAPIVVISSWVNHPELLPIHSIAWKSAFLGDSVEYIVYIDAKDAGMRSRLVMACKQYDIQYKLVPQRLHMSRGEVFPGTRYSVSQAASGRAALVCQLAWLLECQDKLDRERVLFTQSDIIPFRAVSWKEMVPRGGLYYKLQQRERVVGSGSVEYAWDGLLGFDMTYWPPKLREVIHFEYGMNSGAFLDVGGGTWKILRILPPTKKKAWGALESGRWSLDVDGGALPPWLHTFCAQDPRSTEEAQFGEVLDDWAFHIRTVSNWDGYTGPDRIGLFIDAFKESLDLTGANTRMYHRASGAPQ
jgi:hypothetical protein